MFICLFLASICLFFFLLFLLAVNFLGAPFIVFFFVNFLFVCLFALNIQISCYGGGLRTVKSLYLFVARVS